MFFALWGIGAGKLHLWQGIFTLLFFPGGER